MPERSNKSLKDHHDPSLELSCCCRSDGEEVHGGPCCPGWFHCDIDGLVPGVVKCDECDVFKYDEDALPLHDKQCGCGLGIGHHRKAPDLAPFEVSDLEGDPIGWYETERSAKAACLWLHKNPRFKNVVFNVRVVGEHPLSWMLTPIHTSYPS